MKSTKVKREPKSAVRKPDPMLEMAGMLKDDPHFDMVLEEIRKYRRQIDRMMRRASK